PKASKGPERPEIGRQDPDRRILIRTTAPSADADPSIIRQRITTALALEADAITKVTRTSSGLSITPSTDSVRQAILDGSPQLSQLLNATSLDRPEVWTKYLVRRVPRHAHDITGAKVPTAALIPNEISFTAKATPI
ncbi:hypothetical protein F5X68DRAFT_124820, partial [Plectosphaerella plurivora]